MLRSSLPSVYLVVAKLTRRQEFGAKTQSQYVAFLLIPTHHQLAQGLQEISPGREASCLELSMNEREDAGCWRTPSVPLGVPLGQAAPMAESSNVACCSSELHASAGWLGAASHPLQLARGHCCTPAGDDLCHVFISPK
ncbi:hypothetical protein GRJ2_000300100 [Grus japonensis]|uniref:Uncharacterized protein n=1 Tax=Grus japonensis TaxID=30415 RepID=A0ABC9VZT4_GRUJA